MTLGSSLPRLRRGLLRHRLGDEVLVYDTALEDVHLLDGTTARVAELLDQGRNEIDIVAELEGQPGSGAGDPLLALALDELSKADLIEHSQPAPPITDVTRRQLLQKLATVGAGLVIPLVLSLTPGSAGAQASGCGLAMTIEVGAVTRQSRRRTRDFGTQCRHAVAQPVERHAVGHQIMVFRDEAVAN